MNIICPKALRFLQQDQLPELEERLQTFPEDERDGRTDLQILQEEASYLLELFHEPDTTHNLSLKNARRILRETKSGKEMPLLLPSFVPKYTQHHLEECKGIVAEHNRLKALLKTLSKET